MERMKIHLQPCVSQGGEMSLPVTIPLNSGPEQSQAALIFVLPPFLGYFLMLYFKCCWTIQAAAAARQGKGKYHRLLLRAAHSLQHAHFQGWTDIFPDFYLMQKAINYAAISHLISKSESHSSQDCFWFSVLAALCIPWLNKFLMENTQVTKCIY